MLTNDLHLLANGQTLAPAFHTFSNLPGHECWRTGLRSSGQDPVLLRYAAQPPPRPLAYELAEAAARPSVFAHGYGASVAQRFVLSVRAPAWIVRDDGREYALRYALWLNKPGVKLLQIKKRVVACRVYARQTHAKATVAHLRGARAFHSAKIVAWRERWRMLRALWGLIRPIAQMTETVETDQMTPQAYPRQPVQLH